MAATATVEATTAAATTMESAAYRGTMIAAASVSASHCGAMISAGVASAISAAITIAAPVTVSATVSVAVPAAIAIDATVSVAIVSATVPRAGTNEDAPAKPRRTVVAIRRACVGGVAVVAISANGSRVTVTPIHRATDTDPNRDLGMRVSRCRDDQYSE